MRLFLGVALDDSERPGVAGLSMWRGIVRRCYERPQDGFTLCDEWHTFSEFNRWRQSVRKPRKWRLALGIVQRGNRRYSPDLCVFAPDEVVWFLEAEGEETAVRKARVGPYYQILHPRLNPGPKDYRGKFKTEEEARAFWRQQKHQLAIFLAARQHDQGIVEALKNYYR